MTPLKPVTGSTQIASYGYDATSQTMSIVFHRSTKRYDYPDTSPEDAAKFEAAESKGKAFGSLFKGRTFEKVETAPDA